MKKFFGYILSPLFYLVFGLFLVVFHIIQVIALKVFGKNAHKKSVDILNFFLLYCMLILGTRISVNFKFTPPKDRPIIFTANHQSMFDIPGIIWFLRKYYPKFVSKIELGKGIPSISYNLRHSGAALINRKDSKQALTEIAKLGKLISSHNYSVAIFPEGTRSKTGEMKRFAIGGINILLKKAPNALIVPIAIKNNWKVNQYGKYPLSAFENVSWTILPGIESKDREIEDVVLEAETAVKTELEQIKINSQIL
ncbi:1-acyl-sn-glycerol-3-phosphate acyltransferase [Solitalea longa]|uniref:1-acyl-sn-glycerol-3-phosphate acyltransferase n=1 Tax=Solitalea longa TaxID=2079460 RepID=A0A2S5A3H1_9SPHI|nr:lysophospholipid acyltransferase family protein [Solitalea longa]POY37095.1 1-acyl-sn-glycerol-3-phosphate acyltransferase [Solitalea longa]